jgi:hypothetical protein
MKSILATAALLVPMTAYAGGWACTEDGLVQKYRVDGTSLIAVDDPFSKALEQASKEVGTVYKPDRWQILVNNDKGVIAVQASADIDGSHHQYVYSNTLMIASYGGFRHVGVEVNGRITDATGSCVAY